MMSAFTVFSCPHTADYPGDWLSKHYICQGEWRNQVKESHTWLFLWFFADTVFKNLAHEQHKMTKGPANILLGPKFEAKLSAFGLSKVLEVGETYVSSEVRGTFGYVDPEYQSSRHVNSFGDVYSFSVVLLQILSGKMVINLKQRKPMALNKMAKALTRDGSITELVDPKLRGEYSEEAFDFTLHIALSCTALNQQRPSMEQVVKRLEEALLISMKKVSATDTSRDNQFYDTLIIRITCVTADNFCYS